MAHDKQIQPAVADAIHSAAVVGDHDLTQNLPVATSRDEVLEAVEEASRPLDFADTPIAASHEVVLLKFCQNCFPLTISFSLLSATNIMCQSLFTYNIFSSSMQVLHTGPIVSRCSYVFGWVGGWLVTRVISGQTV